MASILDRYGIKEVADVTFYKLVNGQPTIPVLYLDTLKVSTLEQTAENTSARGGKGNPELIMWDYGKEITVTLEDALFSAKSMAIMFGSVDADGDQVIGNVTSIKKTILVDENATSAPTKFKVNGNEYEIPSGAKYYKADGTEAGASGAFATGAAYCVFDWTVAGSEITISSETFPGTYYVTGDTYARSEKDGTDEFFQFIIPKAKVLSEVTLTMEAEGDPSTFSMNLKVLRPADKEMMKLVKYNIPSK